MPLFEIVFKGQVKAGVAMDQARARLGQLFQAGEQQLDVLFSGRRIVIKQNLDEASAEKYRQAIDRAGAVCLVEPMGTVQPAAQPAASPEASKAADVPPAVREPERSARVIPRDGYMAAFSEVQAPDFGIAPLGADMQDEYDDFVALPVDLSALTLAPPGADLDEIRPVRSATVPNTDHLKLQD